MTPRARPKRSSGEGEGEEGRGKGRWFGAGIRKRGRRLACSDKEENVVVFGTRHLLFRTTPVFPWLCWSRPGKRHSEVPRRRSMVGGNPPFFRPPFPRQKRVQAVPMRTKYRGI